MRKYINIPAITVNTRAKVIIYFSRMLSRIFISCIQIDPQMHFAHGLCKLETHLGPYFHLLVASHKPLLVYPFFPSWHRFIEETESLS